MANHQHSKAALPPGYRLQEYTLKSVLGQGSFGITYLAEDTNLNSTVAVKEYFPQLVCRRQVSWVTPTEQSDETGGFSWGLRRFLDEAQILARFDHPNLTHVNRFFEENGTAYIVMRYEKGAHLGKFLAGLQRRPTLEEVLEILMPLLGGLELVHGAGVVHRDIKPENVIIRADGSPVLIDFGAARQAIGHQPKKLTIVATPGYAPPEQFSEADSQGPFTDIYALAAVTYRMLTGGKPPNSIHRLAEDSYQPLAKVLGGEYPASFLQAVDLGLMLESTMRPPDVATWRRMLIKDYEPASTLVLRKAPGSGGPRRTRSSGSPGNKKVPMAVGAAGALAVVALAGAWLGWDGARHDGTEQVRQLPTVQARVPEAPRPEQAAQEPPAPEQETQTSRPGAGSKPRDGTFVALTETAIFSGPDLGSTMLRTVAADDPVNVIGSGDGESWLRVGLGVALSPIDHVDAVGVGYVYARFFTQVDGKEVSAWRTALNSGTTEALEVFLIVYPTGHFSDAAKGKLAWLRSRRQAGRQGEAVPPTGEPEKVDPPTDPVSEDPKETNVAAHATRIPPAPRPVDRPPGGKPASPPRSASYSPPPPSPMQSPGNAAVGPSESADQSPPKEPSAPSADTSRDAEIEGLRKQAETGSKYALQKLEAVARDGHPAAQYALGMLFMTGRGVKRDDGLALVWFDLAEANGHVGASNSARSLRMIMSDTQLSRARGMLGTYRSLYPGIHRKASK